MALTSFCVLAQVQDQTPNILVFDNLSTEVTMQIPGHYYSTPDPYNRQLIIVHFVPDVSVANWFTNQVNNLLFGGGNDRGNWLCTNCSVVPTDAGAGQWGAFIYSVVNAALWPSVKDENGNYIGQWKPGDTVAICDGNGTCVILTWNVNNGTVAWRPSKDPNAKVIKIDKGKYKNKLESSQSPIGFITNATPLLAVGTNNAIDWAMSTVPVIQLNGFIPSGKFTVISGPLVTVPDGQPPIFGPEGGGGGGGGGGGMCSRFCVDTE